ncbi:unnamed protein product [Blepharisma stoltei]|uniref:Uncharacterized protein n=1 Tax=Blepharisma stoltei TaxID=1481888 RepID=A0AAU9IS85_9CILI|nr:unnamed protein product [Blepharisma stoltei]
MDTFNSNSISDSQLESDVQKLNEAKQMRKQVEEDARLLANRIALLKAEEAKAQRHIEETRKRAKDIINSRIRNQEFQKKKEEEQRAKSMETKQRAIENYKRKQNILKAQQIMKNQVLIQKQMEGKSVREAKAHYKIQLERKLEEEFTRNWTIKEQLKKEKEVSVQRRKEQLEQKKLKVRNQLNNRMENESKIRELKEGEIARMEQEELELIQRLQNTQFLQRSAYEDLENALNGGNKMYSR